MERISTLTKNNNHNNNYFVEVLQCNKFNNVVVFEGTVNAVNKEAILQIAWDSKTLS